MSLDSLRAAVSTVARETTEAAPVVISDSLRNALRARPDDTTTLEERIEQGLSFADRLREREETARGEREQHAETERAARRAREALAAAERERRATAEREERQRVEAERAATQSRTQEMQRQQMEQALQTQTTANQAEPTRANQSDWMPGASTPSNLHNVNIECFYISTQNGSPSMIKTAGHTMKI